MSTAIGGIRCVVNTKQNEITKRSQITKQNESHWRRLRVYIRLSNSETTKQSHFAALALRARIVDFVTSLRAGLKPCWKGGCGIVRVLCGLRVKIS
jgi:hypothetical protein